MSVPQGQNDARRAYIVTDTTDVTAKKVYVADPAVVGPNARRLYDIGATYDPTAIKVRIMTATEPGAVPVYGVDASGAATTFGVVYLFRDTFATARAAGAVNGTNAEPGPGTRTVTDASSQLAIAGDELVAAGAGITNFALSQRVDSSLLTGLVLLYPDVQVTTGNNATWGWASSIGATTFRAGFGFPAALRLSGFEDGSQRPSGGGIINVALNTPYGTAVIKRARGNHLFLKVGGAWYLFWPYVLSAPLSVANDGWAGVTTGATTGIRVPEISATAGQWLPAPLVSDGFDRTATPLGLTDGAGHIEPQQGTAFGLGGGGLAWAEVGTWATSAGAARATALSGGLALAIVDGGHADVAVEALLTRPSAGNVGVVVRWSDANNHIRIYHDGTNLKIDKVIAGAVTNYQTAATAYVAGARLVALCRPAGTAASQFNVVYNNTVFVNTVLTIADAALQNGTGVGLYTTDTGNGIDNFVTYQIGGYGSGAVPTLTPAVAPFALTTPAPYQVHQRSGTTGTIPIAGTYRGGGTVNVEARFNGGSWTTIAAGVTGAFSGSLTAQAQGSGSLDVRVVGGGAATVVHHVGIGDVFVVAGQSNASGRANTNQTWTATPPLFAGNFANDYRWHQLIDPSDSDVGIVDDVTNDTLYGGNGGPKGSYWPRLATLLLARLGVPVAFVPTALGGTAIVQWQPGTNHQDRTTLYGAMVYRALQSGGVRAVLWHQGESDATIAAGLTSTAYYQGKIEALGDAVYADLGVPLVAAKVHQWSGAPSTDTTHLGYVNDAIDAAVAGGAHHILAGPNFASPNITTALHLTDPEMSDAATRWDAALSTAGL